MLEGSLRGFSGRKRWKDCALPLDKAEPAGMGSHSWHLHDHRRIHGVGVFNSLE